MNTAAADPGRRGACAERLRTACDLWTAGVELQWHRFRRMHPDATGEVIRGLVNRWLQDRPGAQHGDGPQPTET